MKINLLVRIKNPTFWLTFLPTVVALVYTICEMVGFVPPIAKESMVSAIAAAVSALAALGILVDPTTKGIKDSETAMGYTSPKA